MASDPVPNRGPFQILARRWKVCAAVPLGLAVAALIAVSVMSEQYCATAVVQTSLIDLGANRIQLRGVGARDLAVYFREGALLDAVLSEFDLRAAPYEYDRSRLGESLLEVDVPRDTHRIEVHVRMPSAELARDVANFVARRGAENSRDRLTLERDTMTETLARQLRAAQAELRRAHDALEAFEAEARIGTLRELVAAKRSERARQDLRQADLELELASVRGEIRSGEATLDQEEPTVVLERRLTASPGLQQAAAAASGKPIEDLAGLGLEEAVVNPVYVKAATQLTAARSREAALTAESAALQGAAEDRDRRLAELEADLARKSRRHSELSFDRTVAEQSVSVARQALDEVRTLTVWPPVRLSVVPAAAPEEPCWPRRGPTVLATLLCSFLAVWGVAVLWDRRGT